MAKTLQFEDGKTEKEILELKLKESDLKYRDLFENANDSIYIYDINGYFLDVNSTALKLLGCTKKEIIGTHISQWITPHSLKLTHENLKKCIAGEPAEPMVMEVICKNGEHRMMEIRRRLIKDGDKVIAIHGIGRDITEKMRLELQLKEYHEKLEKSEAKYRELFENAQDIMYVLDKKGNFLNMNRIGLQILGCEKEDVIGSNISEWLTPASLKIAQERLRKRLSGDHVNHTDIIEFACKNGEHRWAEIKSRAIRDGENPREIHGIARDITENKRLKQELRESNKQLQLLRYLMTGTRGGSTRTQIVNHLTDRPYNANQLSEVLNLDYKTVRHHLDVLIKNGIITKGKGYPAVYFLSKNIENLNEFNRKQ